MPRMEIPMGNMNEVPDDAGSPEEQVANMEDGGAHDIKRENFINRVLRKNAIDREAEKTPAPESPEKPQAE